MSFLNPWGFLALLGIPLVVLFYLLKQKYQEKEVSSLFLWKQALSQTLAYEPWQKWKKNLLFFLQIGAVLLLALALANPLLTGGVLSSHVVFGLDCSLSMQTEEGGKSRFLQAKENIKKQVENASDTVQFTLVILKETPEIVIGNTTDKAAFLKQLEQAEVTNGGIHWQDSKALLQLAAEGNGQVVLLTDSYQEIEGEQRIFGEQIENTAITLLSHSQGEEGWQALVKVAYYGETSVEKTVNLFCDGQAFDRKQVTLTAGEQDIVFTGIPQETSSLMATLTPEDSLTADDVAFDGGFSQEKQKVLLVTRQNIFLEKIYSLLPNVTLYQTDGADLTALQGYQLYLFDGILPEVLPTDGYCIFWNPPSENSILPLGETESLTEPMQVTAFGVESFVFDGLEGKPVETMPLWAEPLVTSGEKVFAVTGEIEGRKVAVFGFDLHNTDLPLQKEFPILIYELQAWFFGQQEKTMQSSVVGEAIPVTLLPDTKEAVMVLPQGEQVTIAPPFPPIPFTQTEETGLYTLVQIGENGAESRTTVAVNGKTVGESNLMAEEKTAVAGEEQQITVKTGRSLESFVILALLLLLLVEWRVYWHEH